MHKKITDEFTCFQIKLIRLDAALFFPTINIFSYDWINRFGEGCTGFVHGDIQQTYPGTTLMFIILPTYTACPHPQNFIAT
jgi:hypothetical protein